MRNALRDLFRRIRVGRYLRRHGHIFDYHGVSVAIPYAAGLAAMNALLRGKYERDEALMIQKHLPPDRPVIELGGSLGVAAKLVRSRLAPGVPHLVVEANRDLIALCEANAGSPETTVLHAAVSHDGPVARFRVSDDIHANALDDGRGAGAVVEVPAVTLAVLLARLGDPAAASLVCDIEGGEFDLFEREPAALAAIGLAIVEIHPHAYARRGRSEADFMALAAAAGLVSVDRSADVVVFARRRAYSLGTSLPD